MESEYIIIGLLSLHWVADFLLQTFKMATNKSKSIYWLLCHVAVYSLTFFLVLIFFFNIYNVLIFSVFTFLTHFITDFFTSKWTSKLYLKKKYYGFPSFFGVIGLDQLLHQIQLILGYVIILS